MNDTKSIILAGVGGQGAILVSKVLTRGLVDAGYDVKMSEVHGMAQRGGSVSTQVRFGTKVWSPIVGRGGADIMVAFEKMEAIRYCEFLKPDGIAVINDYEILPMTVASGAAVYPDGTIEDMKKHFRTVVIDAASIASSLGSIRCMNIVLFGAMVKSLSLDSIDWTAVLKETLAPKILDMNLLAFKAGLEASCDK
jgi:indolepyruvate ferredoxin oxidoreductase beta subunit